MLYSLRSAVDWHELTMLQCIMWPSIARTSEQLDPLCSMQATTSPPRESAALGLHPIAYKLLHISRPAKGRRLS